MQTKGERGSGDVRCLRFKVQFPNNFKIACTKSRNIRTPWNTGTPKHPGTPRNTGTPEHPGTPRNTTEHRNTLEHWNGPKLPGTPNLTVSQTFGKPFPGAMPTQLMRAQIQ